MWQKTTASEKSYDIRAVCKLIGMKALKAKQASLLKKNYNHLKVCKLTDVQKLFKTTFSSSFEISSTGFEILVSPCLANLSLRNTKVKVVVIMLSS